MSALHTLSPAQLDAFTGKACIGEKCFGAREVGTQLGGGGNWLTLLQAHGVGREEQASGVRG